MDASRRNRLGFVYLALMIIITPVKRSGGRRWLVVDI